MGEIFPHLDYKPKMPRDLTRGIAIVGAGGIVNYAHLPAYRKSGFRVVGITDRNREAAEKTAKEHRHSQSLCQPGGIAGRPRSGNRRRRRVSRRAAGGGGKSHGRRRHLLCQKPFADEYGKAVRSVELAEAANVKIAVNQQMRWDAGIRCARILIDNGWLGTPTYGTIQVHCNTDWSLWPWIYKGKRLEVMFHSIHYIDSLRFLLGQPNSVFTSGSRGPAETTKAETKTLTVWEYASGSAGADRCLPFHLAGRRVRDLPARGNRRHHQGHHRSDVQLPYRTSGHPRIHVQAQQWLLVFRAPRCHVDSGCICRADGVADAIGGRWF